MPSELEELVEFLHSPQAQIREIALENLVQFSPAGANQKIFKYDNCRAIEDLITLAKDPKAINVTRALTTLANLCDDVEFRTLIVKDETFLKYILQELINLGNSNADLLCILLTNLAKNDEILRIFDFKLELKTEDQIKTFKSNLAMDCIMDLFVKGSERTLNKYANYDYLAYFMADISRFPKGRHYFTQEQEYDHVYPITKLLVFTEKYDSKTRREGVCSTIKNSLFDTDKHMTLMKDEKINLLPYILGPIALGGNKGLDDDEIFNLPDELQLLDQDKKTEPLYDLIAVHLESLLLICVSREGREYLRSKSTYPIIREIHKTIPDNEELCLELCERVVNMLMRDEPPSAEEVQAMHSDNESDEDDDKITEIV
ncbi:hypothetical protein CANARDRAFT_176299 [[Candida] arabinofermentans NRRL YB-2248]|uniref:Protein HGH1 homolog n=1 Tax=[Candida] arabinofermentans NRRL YB-2248 TaxID=983967 RepID=A0A1E4SZC6_9ASCO|nr:hypothetical protein CANARDRAFT_176299 [[Candida] arabinofermentans NRRL YB-2248]